MMSFGSEKIADLIRAGEVAALVFDFDGTLYESSAGIEQQLRPLMVQTAARTLDVSHDEARQVLARYRSQYRSSVLGLQEYHNVDPVSFLEEVYGNLDLSKMESRPGLSIELSRLSKALPLVVFTNSNRSFTYRAIEILGLTDIFESVRTIEDNDFIRKPEPEAYEGLYRSLGLVPEQVAMFDDIVSSLQVLDSFGSNAILVGNGLRPAPCFVDLHTGEEYQDVPDFIDAWTHDLPGFLGEVNEQLGL